jgi:hypothetical protein
MANLDPEDGFDLLLDPVQVVRDEADLADADVAHRLVSSRRSQSSGGR